MKKKKYYIESNCNKQKIKTHQERGILILLAIMKNVKLRKNEKKILLKLRKKKQKLEKKGNA